MQCSTKYFSENKQHNFFSKKKKKKKKKIHFINPLQGNVFPHSVVFTHITHREHIHEETQRIYMHTHNHMQIGEVAEQRLPGTRRQGSSFEVRCLAQGHLGSGLGDELAPLQLPAHSIFFLFFWSDRDVNRRPFGSIFWQIKTENRLQV